ncbi:DNA polymerase alpha catalytic subunit [Chondrus crispus]|uniref:DNA polymerase n=1 Tax=Chondrus crispus TaxID=2769 RepID=R7QS87_CHOCR|nr:DNA polymerase alpha catalytic subunit [Chondrus crispus]CDF40250.1 DNA polymerase alpha catalytic subunit [Chondrus crispus]|eukprot:XP_005710544.1 DNA polymerase alpha catalytic subunit [Chondrus crispus]
MLDADFDSHMKQSRAARRKKKTAVQRAIGDMLFDTPAEPAPHPILQADSPRDDYAAPPPSLTKPAVEPVIQVEPNPVQTAYLEDSLDADMLVAAADAAVKQRMAAPKPPVAPKRVPAATFAERSAARIASAVAPAPVAPNAPLARGPDGEVIMFWTDAHEMRVNGGQHLYMFGKVPVGTLDSGVYASVCVQVQGMERKLYVLPRMHKVDARGRPTKEPVKIVPDVHAEISAILLGKSSGDGKGFAARRSGSNLPSTIMAKKVMRSCPFGDTHAPREATEYLKVKIPFSNTSNLFPESSGKTFSRVYGTKTSASEDLCMKRRLRGPGWVRLTNATPMQSKVSHAKCSLTIPSPMDVTVANDMSDKDPPPVSALCLNAKTTLNPKTGAHEIVMLAGVFVRGVPLSGPLPENALEPDGPTGTRDFILVRAPDGQSVPFGFSDRARSVLARGGGVEVAPNESVLLNSFLSKLLRLDPDVLLGHDLMGFGLDVLIARMNVRRSREWSRLGRLVQRRDLSHVVKNNSSSSWFKSEAVAGRLVVDTYSYAKELLTREKDYSLSALSRNVLGGHLLGGTSGHLPPTTDVSKVPAAFDSTDSLCNLVFECSLEARTAGRLAAHLSVLPLSRQLTCISGNLWSHTLRGARAERIEYLLCHEFKLIGAKNTGTSGKAGDIGSKLLLPDKLTKAERVRLGKQFEEEQNANAPRPPPGGAEAEIDGAEGATPKASAKSAKSKSARRKPQYSGGLVLEPKKGFYDRYTLQLDFNSLYPSIIQEFNICFTTLDLAKHKEKSASELEAPFAQGSPDEGVSGADGSAMMNLPNKSLLEGVLPRVLRRLVEQRRQVKKLLKEERLKAGKETLRAQQLDIRQLAIKLTANSLYGCLGFEGSRFFARPLAEMVTCQGRDTLQKTVDLARDSFNAQVIYGDTDSLFVYTGLDDINRVRKLGTELKREVNKKYRTLEIEIDAIYKKMLLLKKKKYAALKVVDPNNPDKVVREVKGLDLVRHDWCDLSHDASEHFLQQIFQIQAADIDDAVGNIVTFLGELAKRVNNNEISLSKYVITRCLTKRPQDYPEGGGLPHVTVAIRLINEHKKRIKPGDYIKYVVCLNAADGEQSSSGSKSVAQRAYHPDEVIASEGKLVIDLKYYLENQVLPPIMRLCDPIESIEASRIAVSLGLDGRRYERKTYDMDSGNYLALGPQSAAEKFQDVDPLMACCVNCGAQSEFQGVLFKSSGKAIQTAGLDCCKCNRRFSSATLANIITLALRTWTSKYYTSALQLNGDDGSRKRETRNIALGGNGALARRKFDEAWLYKQLRYLRFLVDVPGRWALIPGHEEMKIPVNRADLSMYEELLERVDRTFDANAYRFVDLALFLAPLGIS